MISRKRGVINTISSLFWLINLVVRTTGIFNNQQTFLLKIDDSSGSIMKDFFHGLICGGGLSAGGGGLYVVSILRQEKGGLICGGAYLRGGLSAEFYGIRNFLATLGFPEIRKIWKFRLSEKIVFLIFP